MGDSDEFLRLSASAPKAVVVLSSSGGVIIEAVRIGRIIRTAGYSTAVGAGSLCLSACGLIWVSGKQRFLSPTAVVGFHAAYDNDGVSSGANAIAGSFYGSIGLSDQTIYYLTSAPPQGLNFVNLANADVWGIPVVPLEDGVAERESSNGSQPGKPRNADGFQTKSGRAIVGFDLPDMPIAADNSGQCLRLCQGNPNCHAFTYDSKRDKCYLKGSGRYTLLSKGAVSGMTKDIAEVIQLSRFSVLLGKDSPGKDIAHRSAGSFEECLHRCETTPACRVFTFVTGTSDCWLKGAASKFTVKKGMATGVRGK